MYRIKRVLALKDVGWAYMCRSHATPGSPNYALFDAELKAAVQKVTLLNQKREASAM